MSFENNGRSSSCPIRHLTPCSPISDNIFLCGKSYLTDDYYPNTSESNNKNTDCYSSNDSNEGEIPSLNKMLAQCATRNRWTRLSVYELLCILRENGFSLPKDARTLLKTPRKIPVERKCGGDYAYYGIFKGIKSSLCEKNVGKVIKLSINIDGIPLFKSSNT